MAAAKGSSSPMNNLERALGGIFFAVYLIVLPFTSDALFAGLSRLLGRTISEHQRNMMVYYVLFALTLIIFCCVPILVVVTLHFRKGMKEAFQDRRKSNATITQTFFIPYLRSNHCYHQRSQ